MAATAAFPGTMASLSRLHSAGLDPSISSRQSLHGSSILRQPTILCCSSTRIKNWEMNERSQELQNGVISRREAITLSGSASILPFLMPFCDRNAASAAGLPEEDKPRLCDVDCEKELENIPTQTTPSGLQYKDITVGRGPSPPIGFQVAANYVAMIPSGKVFDSSLEKGLPYIFRVGTDQVIKGLDEGILTMKVGGKRRLYIPGELAFPKGLNAAAGRPRVPPSSPVVFDVNLLYIPGLEDEPEEESSSLTTSGVKESEVDTSMEVATML